MILYIINVAYYMYAVLAQSVARRLGKAEAGGSSPLDSFQNIGNKGFTRNTSSRGLSFIFVVKKLYIQRIYAIIIIEVGATAHKVVSL